MSNVKSCWDCIFEELGVCNNTKTSLYGESVESIKRICSQFEKWVEPTPTQVIEDKKYYSELTLVAEIPKNNQHLINDFAKALVDSYDVYVLDCDKCFELLVKEKDNVEISKENNN